MSFKLCFLSFLLLVKLVKSEMDEYLDESRIQCTSDNDLFSCAKYRTLSYLTSLGHEYNLTGNETGPVKLVKMERQDDAIELFPTARQASSDSEFTKFVKFAKRQANYFFGSQGISIELPEGTQIVEEARNTEIGEERGKKKKTAQVLLPLLILFKIFKIKIMVALVLAGILFIKKIIILGGLALPLLLKYIKNCQEPHFSEHHHPNGYHAHVDLDGYGGGHGGSSGGHTVYGGGNSVYGGGHNVYSGEHSGYGGGHTDFGGGHTDFGGVIKDHASAYSAHVKNEV